MNKLKQGVFALLLIGIMVVVGACNASQEVTSSPHSSSPMQNISSEDTYSSEESSLEVSEESFLEESSFDDASMESSRGGIELPEDMFD